MSAIAGFYVVIFLTYLDSFKNQFSFKRNFIAEVCNAGEMFSISDRNCSQIDIWIENDSRIDVQQGVISGLNGQGYGCIFKYHVACLAENGKFTTYDRSCSFPEHWNWNYNNNVYINRLIKKVHSLLPGSNFLYICTRWLNMN